ncbi:MAG: hypothetical protein JST38_19000 [Bacteroidetes bacterium]|nr:hypothetical protein [Bacteroidota bacterium]
MKLDKPFKGYFKPPGADTRKVCGQVDFDPIQGVQLSTIDSFVKKSGWQVDEQRWDCIHGCSTSGKHLTLLNCKGHESTSIPGFPEGKFWGARLLVGLEPFDPSQPCVKSTAFRLSYLKAWLNISGVHVDENTQGNFRVSHTHPGKIEIYRGDRFSMSIWHRTVVPISRSPDFLERFKEEPFINVDYKELASVEQVVEDMLMLRDLLSVWVVAPVAVEEASVYLEGDAGDETRRFDLYFPLGYDPPTRPDVNRRHMPFPYEDLEVKIQDAIDRWVDLYPKIKPGILFYHEAYFSKGRHAFQKFADYTFSYESINRVLHEMKELPEEEYEALRTKILQELEGAQRTFIKRVLQYANEGSLRKRLKQSFARFGLANERNNEAVREHINRMVQARNNIVHGAEVNSENTVSSENVVNYNVLLRILIYAELLLAIGLVEKGSTERIRRNPHLAHVLSRTIESS